MLATIAWSASYSHDMAPHAWVRPIGAITALLLVLGLAACGTGPDDASSTSPKPTSATSDRGIPNELRFTARTVDGVAFDGMSLAGKDAVLWFWAPWCSDCRREAPHVAAAQDAHPDVVFVGVAGLGELPAMREFVRDYRVGAFVHLADLDGSLWRRFGVVRQPATAFIDASGSVDVVRGSLGAAELERHLVRLTRS
jgi:thiol-disulfide isomerase/thioredoxin